MQFYRLEAKYEFINMQDDAKTESKEGFSIREFRQKSDLIYREFSENCKEILIGKKEISYFMFPSDIKIGTMIFGAAYREPSDIKKDFYKFTSDHSVKFLDVSYEEITFALFNSMVRRSCRYDVVPDEEELYASLGMDEFNTRIVCWMEENIIDCEKKRKDLEQLAIDNLTESTLLPEVNRIYSGNKFKGLMHPVHYMIEEDDKESRNNMVDILIQSLYNNKRIINKRYSKINLNIDRRYDLNNLEKLYLMNRGGTVIVEYNETFSEDGETMTPRGELAVALSTSIKKYRKDVLTIFIFPTECSKEKDRFLSYLGELAFVELKTDLVSSDAAKAYLKKRAKDMNIRSDKSLFEKITGDQSFRNEELNVIFEDWYEKKVRTNYFPQYKEHCGSKEVIRREKHRGLAIDELQSMVGLKSAKETIEKALNYYKIQKMYADMGVDQDNLAMHMIFTGNPGTAKTTVARLFARIMKDNNILSKGELYEVGRSDLVGKYVGHTAPIVKNKFKAAKGSVLFIDEAYSLVDDKDGLYGDEAINTIVQEMENNRDNMIVIFAGYPDKMEGFLNKNPGLRSRIAFHINFDDYTEDELVEILNLIANSKGVHLTEAAQEKSKEIFANARKKADFGNGRFARNLLEQAKINQASRIIKMNADDVTKEQLTTILPEDISDMVIGSKKGESNRIGFSA